MYCYRECRVQWKLDVSASFWSWNWISHLPSICYFMNVVGLTTCSQKISFKGLDFKPSQDQYSMDAMTKDLYRTDTVTGRTDFG